MRARQPRMLSPMQGRGQVSLSEVSEVPGASEVTGQNLEEAEIKTIPAWRSRMNFTLSRAFSWRHLMETVRSFSSRAASGIAMPDSRATRPPTIQAFHEAVD